MLILIGASASGKTEIAKQLIREFEFKKVITYTTRPIRKNEVNHVDYHFLSPEIFEQKEANHFFIETAQYGDYKYGTAFQDILPDTVLIVEPNGANNIYQKIKNKAVYVLLETDEDVRLSRMISRGDHMSDIQKRIQTDRNTFSLSKLTYIDYIVSTNKHTTKELANRIYQLYKAKTKR